MLLKSVLCSMAIFTHFFYKMPSKLAKEFTKIQSKFLYVWGWG